MPLEPEPDLHWTAFLYTIGELPDDEASRFELRLADDQNARDAVTSAVELAGAVAIVGPEFLAKRRSIRRRVFVGASLLAAAACLVLAFVPSFRAIRPPRQDASDVAMAWSNLRANADAEWLTIPPGSPSNGPAEASLVADVESEPSSDRALPSWLLSAASAPIDDDAPRQED